MIVRQFLHWLRTAPVRRSRRSHQRAGARLPLFGSHRQRSRRRRRRHDHAARRSVAAGAPCAGRSLCRQRRRAADGGACARQRSAGRGRADPATLAAAARFRSGRGGRHRRAGAAGRDREPFESAVLGVGGDRRGGLRGGLPDAAGKPGRRNRAVLARPDRAAVRPSGRHSRRAAGARRLAGADAPGAGRQAFGDAGRFRHLARMAGRGSRPPHHPRGLRKGHRRARRRIRRRARCAR